MKTIHTLVEKGNKFMLSEDFGFCAKSVNTNTQEVELYVSHSHWHYFIKWTKVELPLQKLTDHS